MSDFVCNMMPQWCKKKTFKKKSTDAVLRLAFHKNQVCITLAWVFGSVHLNMDMSLHGTISWQTVLMFYYAYNMNNMFWMNERDSKRIFIMVCAMLDC